MVDNFRVNGKSISVGGEKRLPAPFSVALDADGASSPNLRFVAAVPVLDVPGVPPKKSAILG